MTIVRSKAKNPEVPGAAQEDKSKSIVVDFGTPKMRGVLNVKDKRQKTCRNEFKIVQDSSRMMISNFDPLNPFRMLGVFSMVISPRPTGRSGSQLAPEGWKQLEMVASRQLICQLSESFVVMLTGMDSSPVFFHLQKLFLVAPICELFEFNQFSSVMLPWQDMLQLYGRRQCRLGLVTGCKKLLWWIDSSIYWLIEPLIDRSIDWLIHLLMDPRIDGFSINWPFKVEFWWIYHFHLESHHLNSTPSLPGPFRLPGGEADSPTGPSLRVVAI